MCSWQEINLYLKARAIFSSARRHDIFLKHVFNIFIAKTVVLLPSA